MNLNMIILMMILNHWLLNLTIWRKVSQTHNDGLELNIGSDQWDFTTNFYNCC